VRLGRVARHVGRDRKISIGPYPPRSDNRLGCELELAWLLLVRSVLVGIRNSIPRIPDRRSVSGLEGWLAGSVGLGHWECPDRADRHLICVVLHARIFQAFLQLLRDLLSAVVDQPRHDHLPRFVQEFSIPRSLFLRVAVFSISKAIPK